MSFCSNKHGQKMAQSGVPTSRIECRVVWSWEILPAIWGGRKSKPKSIISSDFKEDSDSYFDSDFFLSCFFFWICAWSYLSFSKHTPLVFLGENLLFWVAKLVKCHLVFQIKQHFLPKCLFLNGRATAFSVNYIGCWVVVSYLDL